MVDALKLYQFPVEMAAILEAAEDGELTQEQSEALDALWEQFPEKLASCVSAIRHQEMLEERCQDEITRLRNLKAVLTNRVKSLKTYVLRCMAAAGVEKVETHRGTVSRCVNPRPSIRWDDSYGDIPPEFRKTEIVVKLDSEAARREHDRTGKLPEGFVIELGEHLRLK
jgi:hypothetical protein